MDPANSSVAINISALSVGSYTVTCTSNVSEVSGTPLTSAATFNFSLIFEDIIANVSVDDEMVSLFCSVEANVVPEMMFIRNGSALTGTNVTSNGILHQISLDISTSTFNLGTENITCTSTLGLADMPTLSANINIEIFLENITANSSISDIVIRDDEEMVSLFCSVEANVVPEMMFIRNGHALTGTNVTSNDILHQISLDISTSTFNLGTENITCTSTLGLADMPTLSANINIEIFLENITANSSISDIVIRDDEEMVSLFCSVEANVVPEMMFIRNGSALTGTNVTSNDILHQISLDISTSTFNLGTENITCTSTLGLADMPTLSANINIEIFLENITANSSISDIVIRDDEEMVSLFCSVEANVVPEMMFIRNGHALTGTNVTSNDILHQISLDISTSTFNLGTENIITCTSTLGLADMPALSANISIVSVIFENISITQQPDPVIFRDFDTQTVTLNCTLESSVTPAFTWSRNGDVVSGSGPVLLEDTTYISTLFLTNVTSRGEMVECVVSINISETQAANVSVMVFVFRDIAISPEESVVNITQGEDVGVVTLNCTLEASLIPEIVWTQDGMEQNGTEAVRTEGSDLGVESSLAIDVVDLRGEVSFTCVASLDAISANLSADVTITINSESHHMVMSEHCAHNFVLFL